MIHVDDAVVSIKDTRRYSSTMFLLLLLPMMRNQLPRRGLVVVVVVVVPLRPESSSPLSSLKFLSLVKVKVLVPYTLPLSTTMARRL